MDARPSQLKPHARDTTVKREFSRASRVRHKGDFRRIQGTGRKIYCQHFLLLAGEPHSELSRLGLVVSKRVDKRAVRRNLLKRRLREMFRMHSSDFLKPCDLVVVARAGAAECNYAEIESEVLSVLRAKGVLSK